MTVEQLYLPGCPNHREAAALIREVLAEERLRADLTETPVGDYEEAKKHGFPGSPTFRVNGRDIEDLAAGQFAVGFACRTYLVDGKPQGLPPRVWLKRARFGRRGFPRRVGNEGHTGRRASHPRCCDFERSDDAHLLFTMGHWRSTGHPEIECSFRQIPGLVLDPLDCLAAPWTLSGVAQETRLQATQPRRNHVVKHCGNTRHLNHIVSRVDSSTARRSPSVAETKEEERSPCTTNSIWQ
jgi:hypothetical protein